MKFNQNVELFSLTEDIPCGERDFNYEDLPIVHRGGQDYIMVTLTDHSMFDRFFKEDLLRVSLQDKFEEGDDVLMILPNGSVACGIIRSSKDTLELVPFNQEFYETQSYAKDAIQILGVVRGAVRIN